MLEEMTVSGLRTNRQFLIDVLSRPSVKQGQATIGWLEREPVSVDNALDENLARISALYLSAGSFEPWRSTGPARTIILLKERAITRRFDVHADQCEGFEIAGVHDWDDRPTVEVDVIKNGVGLQAHILHRDNFVHIHLAGRDALFEDITYAPAEPKGGAGANVVRAPMAGRIVKVTAEPGMKVVKGQLLVILEAMKMEHELRAAADGIVDTVAAKPGDQVAIRQTLVSLKAT